MEKRALGKGLGALITPTDTERSFQENIMNIPISQIKTNKYQPRVDFNKERLEELVSSIREKGVVQPVLVRRTTEGYELIAGERRLRAVRSLGIEKIPAIVRNVNDVDMLEISLIENIQREELNAMEEAIAFQKFITDFGFTQEKIAKVLGKDRSTIANTIRLLGLPKKIQDYIVDGTITAGHARALLPLPTEIDQMRVCTLIVKKGLSVREAENIVSSKSYGMRKITPKSDNNMADIESELQHALGTRVKVFHGKKRGRIMIEYYSTDDLNRILGILGSKKP
ncbi:MAG: ParB/RepB/Spo0J family partition protein [Candidatus Omnitrophota bacterium]